MTSLLERFKRFLLWLSGASVVEGEGKAKIEAESETAMPPIPSRQVAVGRTVLGDPVNDAAAYGVAIEPVSVPEGTAYWRVIRVHHLTPEENHGNHHIYLDALDEAGHRVFGAQARVSWDGGQNVVIVEKPLPEPGANEPMWKWQVCSVEMLGLPSDRVVNLHTAHPDEPPGMGNTLFHHSFHVDFQRSTMGPPPASHSSVISGQVTNGMGHTVRLSLDGSIVATFLLGTDSSYRFEGLAAGTYALGIEGSALRSRPVTLDGTNTVVVDLVVPPADPGTPGKPIRRYVLFGAPQAAYTVVYTALAQDYLIRHRPAFGFRVAEAEQAAEVLILGTEQEIGPEVETRLGQAGCRVHRIQGSADEITAALRAL